MTIVQGQNSMHQLHEIIETVGLVLIVIGILGRMWCTLYIGGRKSAQMVTSGPYSMTRNPLYLFSSIASAGIGAQAGSISLALLAMLVCAGAFQLVIGREERHLEEKFGAAFLRYRNSVPRFLPNLSLYRDVSEIVVRPRLVYTTLADGLIFFAAIPLLEGIEHLQRSGVLPILLRAP